MNNPQSTPVVRILSFISEQLFPTQIRETIFNQIIADLQFELQGSTLGKALWLHAVYLWRFTVSMFYEFNGENLMIRMSQLFRSQITSPGFDSKIGSRFLYVSGILLFISGNYLLSRMDLFPVKVVFGLLLLCALCLQLIAIGLLAES